jgi:hypothetical protein
MVRIPVTVFPPVLAALVGRIEEIAGPALSPASAIDEADLLSGTERPGA